MPADPPHSPAYRLIEDALRQLDPAEVPYLPEVWSAYLADPRPYWERPPRDDLLGYGDLAAAISAWSPLVVGFLGGVLTNLAADGVAKGGTFMVRGLARRWRARWRARQMANRPAGIPALGEKELVEIAEHAGRAADLAGLTAPDKARFVEVVVDTLRRHAEQTAQAGSAADADDDRGHAG